MADTTAKQEPQPKRKKQGRSPAYPGLPLKDALAKATALYQQEGKYPAPMPSAFKAWGFGAKSSGGREVRAALKYFGLITIEGDAEAGKVKLTDDALRVLLDQREDQTEKRALLRRLALTPPIHKKLFEKFPEGIKSRTSVAHDLTFEEGYNPNAAAELVLEFEETASYAGLFEPDMMPDIKSADAAESPHAAVRQEPPAGLVAAKQAQNPAQHQVHTMQGERIVFTEEGKPSQYLKLIASGDLDQGLLEALEDFVKRQRKRLQAEALKEFGVDQ